MTDHDVRILETLEAQVARSAERYEAAANNAADPRLVTPLNDRANERRRAAAALAETAREIGGVAGAESAFGGSIGRMADGLRAALAGDDDHATLTSLARMEEELGRAFEGALDEEPSPQVRGEIGAIAGSIAAARKELRHLLETHAAP